jgi:arabinan endo-1,5-alpha-L-arabinosidase
MNADVLLLPVIVLSLRALALRARRDPMFEIENILRPHRPWTLATALLLWACGDAASQGNSGTSGEAGVGAAFGAGGASAAGGSARSSGSSATVGDVGASGAAGPGGLSGSSGAAGSAGNGGSGGSAGSAGAGGSGGSAETGGVAGAIGSAGAGGSGGMSTYPSPTTQHLTIGVHDPSMIHAGSKYYLFATGGRLGIRSSSDLMQWSNSATIFATMPAWIATELGQQITDLWAPDISFYGGLYHVYYAGSVFGSNHSVIGLATNTTLDPASASYKWVDQGLVIESNKRGSPSDDWNAIDPNLTFDTSGQPWLVFGSFWSGIKLRQVDPATGKLSTNTQLYALANDSGGIEAASIVSHNGYYYLFVSYDLCCKGVNSTYRTMVGRASAIIGPYTNRNGQAMLQGNAEQMLATSGRYIGPGGGTAFQDGNLYYYVYHYYDGQAGQTNGNPYLMMRPILWGNDDWPTFDTPLWQ